MFAGSGGVLPSAMRQNTLAAAGAVLSQIDAEGMVQGMSYGTVISDCLDDYRRVALRPTGYGQNLTLLMMTELMLLAGGKRFQAIKHRVRRITAPHSARCYTD